MKILIITHKPIYFSKITKKYSSFGGFSPWNNFLSRYVNELHILSPLNCNKVPAKTTNLFDTIKVHPIVPNETILTKGLGVLKTITQTLKVVKTYQIDCIVCKTPGLVGTLGFVGALFSRKPTVLQIVGDELEINKTAQNNILAKSLRNFFTVVLLFLSHTLSTIIIVQSQKIKSNLLKFGANTRKIVVIPETTIDATFFKESKGGSKEARKTILYVGRLSAEKGLLVLMKALGILKRSYGKCTSFKLVLVGSGNLEYELRKKAKEYDIESMVEFKGVVPHDEVIDYITSCNIFVLPSLSEGMAKVLLEAMAAARPIVSTYAGGIPEVIENGVNGLLVRTNDSSALADALHRLLKDEALAIKLGQEGRRKATAYTLERIMPFYISSLTRALGK